MIDFDAASTLFWRNLMIQHMLNPKLPSGGGFFRGAPGGGRGLPIGTVTSRVPDKEDDEEDAAAAFLADQPKEFRLDFGTF